MSVFAFFIFFLQFHVGFLLTSYFDKEKRLTKAERYFATMILGPTTTCFILLCFLLILGSWKISIFCLWISLVACLFYTFSKLPACKITKFTFHWDHKHSTLHRINLKIAIAVPSLAAALISRYRRCYNTR